MPSHDGHGRTVEYEGRESTCTRRFGLEISLDETSSRMLGEYRCRASPLGGQRLRPRCRGQRNVVADAPAHRTDDHADRRASIGAAAVAAATRRCAEREGRLCRFRGAQPRRQDAAGADDRLQLRGGRVGQGHTEGFDPVRLRLRRRQRHRGAKADPVGLQQFRRHRVFAGRQHVLRARCGGGQRPYLHPGAGRRVRRGGDADQARPQGRRRPCARSAGLGDRRDGGRQARRGGQQVQRIRLADRPRRPHGDRRARLAPRQERRRQRHAGRRIPECRRHRRQQLRLCHERTRSRGRRRRHQGGDAGRRCPHPRPRQPEQDDAERRADAALRRQRTMPTWSP